MPSSKRFILKDSPPEVRANSKCEPQGRRYCHERSQQPGGIHIDDLVLGMKLMCLAITDDQPDMLKKVARVNPWQLQVLTMITGSEEEAHKPLSELLQTHFDLHCDHHIDVSGMTRACHALDTQGYIAHNDDMIVLSYRCTTSAFDWLTNMTTTSSAWEEEDFEQGHSGYISCIAGACCVDPGEYKPRVHTGFYNNFLVTIPAIREHIEPLLLPDQLPRKLYIVGHSLGAGIATMATCYFLLHHDWAELPHKLITVTAGSPRACLRSMQERIDQELKRLRPLDKAVVCRVVRDKDVVVSVPPAAFGFQHIDKLVYLTKDDAILINPSLESRHIVSKRTLKKLLNEDPSLLEEAESYDSVDQEQSPQQDSQPSKYEKQVKLVPRSLRDHMPDFYLKPLLKLVKREAATPESTTAACNPQEAHPHDKEGVEVQLGHTALE